MDSGFCVSGTWNSGFHKQIFPRFWNPDLLTWGKTRVDKDKMAQSILSSKTTDLFSQGSSHNAQICNKLGVGN